MQVTDSPMDNTGIFGWFTQTVSAGAIAAALSGVIPFFLVLIPILYYLLMIWEMKTVQHAVNNWRQKRIAKKYVKAQAKAKVAIARLEAIELLRHARHEARAKVEDASSEAAKIVIQKTADVKLPPV